jgi:hypothetical protein
MTALTTPSAASHAAAARLALPRGAQDLRVPGRPQQRLCGHQVLWIALLSHARSRLGLPWPAPSAQPMPAR